MLKLVRLLGQEIDQSFDEEAEKNSAMGEPMTGIEEDESEDQRDLGGDEMTREDEREGTPDGDSEDNFLRILEECATSLLSEGEEGNSQSLSLIRCAAHCLNLAVKDSLKDPTTSALVNTFRKLSKKLRTPTITQMLRRQGLQIPILDVETRWFSTADMLEVLLQLRDFVLDNKYQLKVNVSSRDFDKVEDLQKTLRPARELCTRLQAEQLVVGDFFGAWLECKLSVKSVGLPFSAILYKNMEKREHDLFKSPAIVSSLYLDPRYFTLLTPDACKLAENSLEKTWVRIVRERKRHEEKATSNSTETSASEVSATPPISDSNEDVDPLEALLKKCDEERAVQEPGVKSILPMLREFKALPRIPRNSNLLEYWESQKYAMLELYALATVVHAAPSTEVSVERLFSGVKFVLSPQRSNLRGDTLDDIMVIRTNSLFRGHKTPKKRRTTAA